MVVDILKYQPPLFLIKFQIKIRNSINNMKINKSCKLFLRNIYSYDIESCHLTILKNLNHDIIPQIINLPKLDRNIRIGKLMREEPKLIELFKNIVNTTIDKYLSENNIDDDSLITRQYDGFLTSKKLKDLNIETPVPFNLQLRNIYSIIIISSMRDSYIAKDENNMKYSFKGISNRYSFIDNIYKDILNINYMFKMSIFKNLDKIKKELLFNKDINTFFIPNENDLNHGNIILNRYGNIEISSNVLSLLKIEDIDRKWYYDSYIRNFCESILLEFL